MSFVILQIFCNGNTIDNQENLISCSHGGRCIYKTDDNLNISILIDQYEGKKFNSPNDICIKSDGHHMVYRSSLWNLI